MPIESYEVIEDPYVYKNTDTLKNRLGIRDAGLLEEFEVEMSTLRSEEAFPSGNFDARHYRSVHKHLFQDVYKWAGKYRTIRISKDGNLFCYPEFITAEMDKLFSKARIQNIISAEHPLSFTEHAADFIADLNAIHPFREGNGRTQLAFLYLLSVKADRPLDLKRVRGESFYRP